jgi:23S rRNA pseudouridine1911/1915/1917 synthase
MQPNDTLSDTTIVLDDEVIGMRLDAALARQLTQMSRSRIQKLIVDGNILLNDQPASQRSKVQGGEIVTIHLPDVVIDEFRAEPIPLIIRHEDEDIIILDKPAGLVVHPGAGNPNGTLMNALLYHDERLFALPRAGIVHRLDKDTSGLMVVAKNELSRQFLTEAIKLRQVTRIYRALVQGKPLNSGTVDAPIGRHSQNRLKMTVRHDGRPALSHYRVLQRFDSYCFCEVKLETGRTHQIRVHMAHLGFPLVGDPLYAGRPRPPAALDSTLRDAIQGFPRQALHAYRLSLAQPRSGELIEIKSELPEDFAALLEQFNGNKKPAPQ